MLGHRVRLYFMDGETVDGELRQQNESGVWLYHGWPRKQPFTSTRNIASKRWPIWPGL